MARLLKTKRVEAASGEATSLVIFLHGYGADAADLLGLAEVLAPHFPDTAFLAPDAPERAVGNPAGFQWFPIPWLDGSDETAAQQGIAAAREDLTFFLGHVLANEGVPVDKVIVFGFSQGTMMALDVVPRLPEPIAGIVAFSGRTLDPETYGEHVTSRPPVVLIHGDQDEMVPVVHYGEAAEVLKGAGFTVYGQIQEGTGHGIGNDGLSAAVHFMAQQLGVTLDLD